MPSCPARMPPAREVERARDVPGRDHGDEAGTGSRCRAARRDRRARRASPRRAVVRDQRIGDQREHFVEQEQREQVGGEGDADRRGERQREADVEARLVRLAVAAHVADRVQRVDDPQPGGDQREQHAQRLDLERERQARQQLERARRRAARRPARSAAATARRNSSRRRGERHRLAQVRSAVRSDDQQRARPAERRARPGSAASALIVIPPSSASAARAAAPTGSGCRGRSRRPPPPAAQAGTSSAERRFAQSPAPRRRRRAEVRDLDEAPHVGHREQRTRHRQRTRATTGPVSSAASTRYHLLTNPAVPGTPIRLKPPTTMPAQVSGMALARPCHAVEAARCATGTPCAPASRNSAPLVTPWLNRCTMPPVSPVLRCRS